jgi:hypothetical protein
MRLISFKLISLLITFLLLSSCRDPFSSNIESRFIDILQECQPQMSSSEASEHLQVLPDLENSFHELVACGGLTYTLIDTVANMPGSSMFGQSASGQNLSDLKYEGGYYILNQSDNGTVMKIKLGKDVGKTEWDDFEALSADLMDPSNYFSNPKIKISTADGDITLSFDTPGSLASEFDLISIFGLKEGQNEIVYHFEGLKAFSFLDGLIDKLTFSIDLLRGKLVISIDNTDLPSTGDSIKDVVIGTVKDNAVPSIPSSVEVDLPQEFTEKYQAFQAQIDALKIFSYIDIKQVFTNTIIYTTELTPMSIADIKRTQGNLDPSKLSYKLASISTENKAINQKLEMTDESWEVRINQVSYQLETDFNFVVSVPNRYRLNGNFKNGRAILTSCEPSSSSSIGE